LQSLTYSGVYVGLGGSDFSEVADVALDDFETSGVFKFSLIYSASLLLIVSNL